MEPSLLHDAVEGRPVPEWFAVALAGAFAPRVTVDDFVLEPLTSRPEASTIHTMHTRAVSPEPPKVGRPSRLKDHPLMKGLAAKGVTLVEEAKAVRRSVSGVRSFCFPPDDVAYRPIPDDLKKRWKELYGVPLNTWPKKGV